MLLLYYRDPGLTIIIHRAPVTRESEDVLPLGFRVVYFFFFKLRARLRPRRTHLDNGQDIRIFFTLYRLAPAHHYPSVYHYNITYQVGTYYVLNDEKRP